MRKSTHSFEPYLEIYRVIRTQKTLRYHLAHSQPARSFVKQWPQLLKCQFQGSGESNIKDTAGSLRYETGGAIRLNPGAGISTHGIVLGTGNTAVALADYKLETQIAHGAGAGQLSYAIEVFDAFEVVGSTARFRTKRQFSNTSGGTITVKEAGLYAFDASSYYFCIARDVLAVPFDIQNAQIAEFRYTLKATV